MTGAIVFGTSKADAEALRGVMQGDTLDVSATAKRGQGKETAGLVLLTAGSAVLVGGVIWGLVGGGAPAKTSVGVAVIPDGATVVFSGALP